MELLDFWSERHREINGHPEPSWKSIVSEDLLELPSYIYNGSDRDIHPEWTYVIDLDREVFGVENVAQTPLIWFSFR